MCPQYEFCSIALQLIDQVITAYASVIQLHAAPRMVKNLRWLRRLHIRAAEVLDKRGSVNPDSAQDMDTDTGLLGWRTRLIERAGRDKQKATTVISTSPFSIPSFEVEDQAVARQMPDLIPPSVSLEAGLSNSMNGSMSWSEDSTNQLLHEFWDPTLALQMLSGSESDPASAVRKLNIA